MDLPAITHDTRRILSANQRALELFRCDLVDIIDADMAEGIVDADMRELMRLRMRVLREQGFDELRPINFDFLRHDGSAFQAKVRTTKLSEGVYQTTFEYLGES